MRPQGLIKGVIALVIIIALLASTFAPIAIVKAASAPSLDVIKDRVKNAKAYIDRLSRWAGSYHVISEYPALPIVYKYYGIWFIPGLHVPYGDGYTYVEISDQSFETVGSSTGAYTIYKWYMNFYIYDSREGPALLMKLYVEEWRIDDSISGQQTMIKLKVDVGYGGEIYLAGTLVIDNAVSGVEWIGVYDSYDVTFPSMRSSVRHVDALYIKTYRSLGVDDSKVSATEQLMKDIMANIFGDNLIREVYYSMFAFLPAGIEAPETQCSIDGWKWYDGQWVTLTELGYSRIYDIFDNEGVVITTYPAYPYKSKIVTVAESTHTSGGDTFLAALQALDDPFYHEVKGLYYAAISQWSDTLNEWNKVVSAWDGDGIYVSNQNGYSTVRLALAVALGSILAGKGYISWDTVDEMANVLVQLQWKGVGHYSPDGQNVYTVIKPDCKGGFLVSYGPIGSYGYVPFRPSLIEDILNVAGAMEPEYGGIMPTNSESTLLSMVALMLYAQFRYGIDPPSLLQ